MQRKNFILLVCNAIALASGIALISQSGQGSPTRTQVASAPLPDAYDIVGSADLNNDGQIASDDVLLAKSCVTSLNASTPDPCRGLWQQLASDPDDGSLRYQKVGHADVSGDGRVTLSDALYVKGCMGRLPPDPCYGTLKRRIMITGRVVNPAGEGVAGVAITAQGQDSDGDPYPQ
jgi:hypothetical protein